MSEIKCFDKPHGFEGLNIPYDGVRKLQKSIVNAQKYKISLFDLDLSKIEKLCADGVSVAYLGARRREFSQIMHTLQKRGVTIDEAKLQALTRECYERSSIAFGIIDEPIDKAEAAHNTWLAEYNTKRSVPISLLESGI